MKNKKEKEIRKQYLISQVELIFGLKLYQGNDGINGKIISIPGKYFMKATPADVFHIQQLMKFNYYLHVD